MCREYHCPGRKRNHPCSPLALAKPTQLINAIYQRLKTDPDLHFTLVTAVSLEKPTWSNELEQRLLSPLVERIWGGFVDFDYVLDMRKNQIPPNFQLLEFFNKAGAWMSNAHAGQNYLGSNYTHAVRDAMINLCNVLSQLVAKKEIHGKTLFSMGSNPDTHLEGARAMLKQRAKGKKVAIVAQVNTNLPFMYGKAVVEPDLYDPENIQGTRESKNASPGDQVPGSRLFETLWHFQPECRICGPFHTA